MKKKLLNTLIALIIILSLSSCKSDDKERILDFTRDFATIINVTNATEFEIDNGKRFVSNSEIKTPLKKGDRVIVTYTINPDKVSIHSITKISLLQIVNSDKEEWKSPENAPINIQSVWCRSKYINLIFDVEFHSKQHVLGLYKHPNKPDSIYIFHSRQNDPSGYMSKRYISIDIEKLKMKRELPSTIYLHTITKKGKKVYPLLLEE